MLDVLAAALGSAVSRNISAVAVLLHVGLPLGVVLLAWSRTKPRPGESRALIYAVSQVGVLLGGLIAYKTARVITESDWYAASENAVRLINIERSLGLWIEPGLQRLIIDHDVIVRAFNANYAFGYFPFLICALVWLFMTDQPSYRLLRNGLGISAVLAVLTFALLPVAPPRLVAPTGVIDTVAAMGTEITFTNEYAAVPSLHVGWMFLAGYALSRQCSGKLCVAVAVVPGALMWLTTVATGNHYWLDGLVGIAFCMIPARILAARAGAGPLSLPRVALPESRGQQEG